MYLMKNRSRVKKFARPDDAKRALLADVLVRSVIAG